jgi:hypothetical protein
MKWFFRPLNAFWSLIRSPSFKKKGHQKNRENDETKTVLRRGKTTPFYAQIPTTKIRLYQTYIDRAFQLSPTLEFEKDDSRFHSLLNEAAHNDALSQLDLELMRMQYVLADREMRQAHRHRWAVKVINRRENDFFPSPWAVLSSLFAGERQVGRSGYANTIQ